MCVTVVWQGDDDLVRCELVALDDQSYFMPVGAPGEDFFNDEVRTSCRWCSRLERWVMNTGGLVGSTSI